MPFASYHKQQSRVYPSISNRAEWRRQEKARASRVGGQEGGVENGADVQEGRLNGCTRRQTESVEVEGVGAAKRHNATVSPSLCESALWAHGEMQEHECARTQLPPLLPRAIRSVPPREQLWASLISLTHAAATDFPARNLSHAPFPHAQLRANLFLPRRGPKSHRLASAWAEKTTPSTPRRRFQTPYTGNSRPRRHD
jgi:hypothetical protein